MKTLFNFVALLQFLLLAIILPSCSPLTKVITSAPETTSVPKPIPIYLSLIPQSSSPLLQALFEAPEVTRSFATATVAKAQVAIATSAKSTKVDLSGSTGLTSESNSSAVGTAVATIKANRLLYDSGQTDRSIRLSILDAQSASHEAEITVGKTLQKIAQAYDLIKTGKETLKIIDYYLGLYNAREDLVKLAVQANTLSNSNYLELKSLKNKTLTERAQSELSIRRAESFLENTFGVGYKSVMPELAERYKELKAPIFFMETSVQKKLIDLREAKLVTQIEIQKALNKPTTQLQISVSNTQHPAADTTVFAGITLSLPINDGGEAKAQIEALSEELIMLDHDLKVLKQSILQAKSNWEAFIIYHQIQKSLLLEGKTISLGRMDELELLLRAGRSNISEIAKEIFVGAQTEIALVKLKSEYLSQSIEASAMTSQTCRLFNLCDLINRRLQENL